MSTGEGVLFTGWKLEIRLNFWLGYVSYSKGCRIRVLD